jgi:hypothetical protein
MNKKAAFVGFVSGNITMFGTAAFVLVWKKEYIGQWIFTNHIQKHVVFRYFETLLDVVKEDNDYILDDSRLKTLEEELEFNGIVKGLNIRES